MLRDAEWLDSVSVLGVEAELPGRAHMVASGKHEPAMSGNGGYHRGRKFSVQHGASSGQRLDPDRKTDLEKLYWSGSLAAGLGGGEKPETGGQVNGKRQEANGFNHSVNAAFDEIDKSFWNEKSFDDLKTTGGGAGAEKDQRRLMTSYPTYQTYHKQFGSETVEKFYWNDKIPGEQEDTTLVKPNIQTPAKMPPSSASQTQMAEAHQAQAGKEKLSGMREFINFNDEEKLYWNEKLHQVSTATQGSGVRDNTQGSSGYQLSWTGPGAGSAVAGAVKHHQAEIFSNKDYYGSRK